MRGGGGYPRRFPTCLYPPLLLLRRLLFRLLLRGGSASVRSRATSPLFYNATSRIWIWIQVKADNIAEQFEQPCLRKGGLRRQTGGAGVRVRLRRQLQEVVSHSTAQLDDGISLCARVRPPPPFLTRSASVLAMCASCRCAPPGPCRTCAAKETAIACRGIDASGGLVLACTLARMQRVVAAFAIPR